MSDAIKRLQDRLDIQDLMFRYSRGVDRRDWEQVRDCFHADSYIDHVSYRGDRDGFIDWLIAGHTLIDISTHMLGNCLIEFADDTHAVVETYGLAFLRLSAAAKVHKQMLLGDSVADDDAVDSETLVRYADKFEKRDGAWRISNQNVIVDASRSRVAGPDSWVYPSVAAGRRDRKDDLYRVRAEMKLPG